MIAAVRTTSGDPDLDLLVLRFHLETGARRQGALNLRRSDLDPTRATVWLREKSDSEREQPVSPSLVALLEAHHDHRGPGDADGPLFRTRDGGPMSARHYDTLFARARGCLDWTDRTPVSAHVLRHTAITAVGRLAGYPVAQAFVGHTPPSVTGRYLHASLAEVASAVATLTGEPHPLAARLQRSSGSCCRRLNQFSGSQQERESFPFPRHVRPSPRTCHPEASGSHGTRALQERERRITSVSHLNSLVVWGFCRPRRVGRIRALSMVSAGDEEPFA